METLPAYVSIVFILTTFATLGFLLYAIRAAGIDLVASRILIFILPLWIFFQAALALGGFYLYTEAFPPRMLVFGVLPAVLLIFVYLVVFRETFISRLPLKILTLLHVVRIPVEIVLLWLFLGGQIPQLMTFEGRNFDILSGLLAPVVYWAAFRGAQLNRWLIIAYNILGLALLANIVGTAVVSLPSPMQTMAFEQPNRAVLFFPYVWLPTIVIPIVFFSHLASLWKVFTGRNN